MDGNKFCEECGRLNLKDREVFDLGQHCSCQMSDSEKDLLISGATYVEQSVEKEINDTIRQRGLSSLLADSETARRLYDDISNAGETAP